MNIEEANRRIEECLRTGSESLDLSGCGIQDLNNMPRLQECTQLTDLRLDNNPINNLSPLRSLRNLTNLSFSWSRINDISALVNLTNLTTLMIDYNQNQILNINSLSSLTSLTKISICNNPNSDFKISEIRFIDKMVNLKELILPNNDISDLNILASLFNLTHLNLYGNGISDISPLEKLTDLTSLYLGKNQISDISPLRDLTNLRKLKLERNRVSDMTLLGDLTNLKELMLEVNQISDISPLERLINLTELSLVINKINDISPLRGLRNLTVLWLGGNQISDIAPLKSLTNLTRLYLERNQISDFRPLFRLKPYREGELSISVAYNPNEMLNQAVDDGYDTLKQYYDELDQQGAIPNDYLKVIVLGNSTAGKTSLVNYWGKKTFDDKQVTTHGIFTPMDIPLENDQKNVRVNVWDFGGQDYYHATHRLFITRDSTFILVCVKELENKPEEELSTEYMYDEKGEVIEKEVPVQHYPYTYWTDTIAHLTDANNNPAVHKMPLFLVENKCALYAEDDNSKMILSDEAKNILPFEIIGHNFYHLDIKAAHDYHNNPSANLENAQYALAYQKFERKLISTLQEQIEDNLYEVLAYFPEVRDTLEKLANAKQGKDSNNVIEGINRFLIEKGIKPIEEFEKLPVWISYQEYKDIVKQSRRKKDNEENIPWDSLHIYLQNLCGRIFHFKDIPELKDIVFIDPNWLHTAIYRVLNMEILEKDGEFTIEEADKVIDGDILDASTFLEAMKAFELIFEIPNQQPRTFIAPQYLPKSKLDEKQLKRYKEVTHNLALTLKFPKYLPPSLISRIISLKGHLIKEYNDPLWKYGVVYVEDKISTFIHCLPSERKIEIYLADSIKELADSIKEDEKKKALRQFMAFMEEKFSSDLNEMYLALPGIEGEIKWRDLYIAKQDSANKVKGYTEMNSEKMIPLSPFEFLIRDFEKKPVNIFICYSHEVRDEMELFKIGFEKQLESFCSQHKIKFNLFSDLELAAGDFWDTKIQSNININDVLICLLSPGFFTSDYIQQQEYGRVFEEIASKKRNTLIVPVNFQSCYINELNNIKKIQFFSPQGKDFGLLDVHGFSFFNLLGNDKQHLIANYMTTFFEAFGPRIIDVWKNSSAE